MTLPAHELVHVPEGFVLKPEDEFPHPAEEASNFNESVYCSGFDAKLRAGVWMRLGNRVNEGYAELSVLAYLPDGRLACQFARPAITANDRFEAGGLRYQCLEPFEQIEMVYDGEMLLLDDPAILRDPKRMFETAPRVQGAIRLDARAVAPAHGGEVISRDYEDQMMYGYDFSRGHFNQHVASKGSMQIGDEHWDLDAFGWRDHSWGPRFWQEIWFYRLFIANFGADRGLMLLRNTLEDGRTKRLGVLLVDGVYEEVIDLDITTEWSDEQDPVAVTIGVRTENRKELIYGRTVTLAPLRNRRKAGDEILVSRVAEAFTEFTWGDRTGYGIMEYIERIDNGSAVGFPL